MAIAERTTSSAMVLSSWKNHPAHLELIGPSLRHTTLERERTPEDLIHLAGTFMTAAERKLFLPHAQFALKMHKNQTRKFDVTEYVKHPLRSVITLLMFREQGLVVPFSHILIMAGHDTREDRPEDMAPQTYETEYYANVGGKTPLNEEVYNGIVSFDKKFPDRTKKPHTLYYPDLDQQGLGYLKAIENIDSNWGDHALMHTQGRTNERLAAIEVSLKKLRRIEYYLEAKLPEMVKSYLQSQIEYSERALKDYLHSTSDKMYYD